MTLLSAPDDTTLGLRDRALLAVLYSTGLRAAEVVAFDLGQVDLSAGEVASRDRRGRARPAFLGHQARAQLDEYLLHARPRFVGATCSRALFLSRKGERLSVRSVEHIVRTYGRQVGLSITPRDLRLACATHLRQGGATATAIKGLLGTVTIGPRGPAGGAKPLDRPLYGEV